MHRLLPLAAALALAACATSQPSERGVPSEALPLLAPSAGATVQAGLAIDRWWILLGDAELERRIDAALRRNQDLALAAARLREARARLDEVHGARSPALELQATSARSRQSADTQPLSRAATGSQHGVSLVARHEIDLWGRLASADDAARQRLAAQGWAHAAVAWGLSAQVAEAHITQRALQRQIDISEAVRASRGRTLALRQREHAAGATSEFELRRAEAELAGAESTLAALQRQRVALERTLALLTGQPLAELARAEAPATALDPSAPFVARLPQGDAAQWLQRRPDVRQAEAELAATRHDIAVARAAILPQLVLSGSVGSDVRTLSNLFNGPGFAWSVAGSVAQSLFDGGQKRARVEQADARAEAAQAQYRRSVANALLEAREAYAALDIAQAAHQAERSRVAALERARALAQAGVRAGALTQLDLLDAERNSHQAQLAEVDAYRDRLLGLVAAYKSLGGGYAIGSAS